MSLPPLLDLTADPFVLFSHWLEEAAKSEPNDPNAMAVATATPDGRPSVRMLLLKGFDERGFVFYTNLNSRKGQELLANPFAALLFHWKSLKRQVRIEGAVSQVSPAEADEYFASRSHTSRLGAIASNQSHPLDHRETFEGRLKALELEYQDKPIPRPQNWHGFRVKSETIEFWQDRPFRLHDRAVWTLTEKKWTVTRLYP
ncbi:pyridoxamine 5'-phosphate oxidase [Swingsia samuiensis]|uniref:Pyridoxine/pyridoxamine 5'-phosphate oxidase n=1 Tax=Swingsia samuiensis TaxID=1293412 RepID=A0A4Y6UMS3_9PROT|nr:pyridoxamine 5'-phosphate oxidase [Swingsia samuiensis]QDH17657.1 pyridoxamine 5'-phosphate oxidase [Swingsia samuiensis]